jgi:hypothetical protein
MGEFKRRIVFHLRRWAGGALALALVTLPNGVTRADVVYGYAEQTVSGLTVTGPTGGLLPGTFTGSATGATAIQNGTGIETADPTDTPLAYVGALPHSPQNSYVRYSALIVPGLVTSPPGPQAGDFTRGDALLTGVPNLFTTGITASNVSESFQTTGGAGPGMSTGKGTWTVGGGFAPGALVGLGSMSINYAWTNDLVAYVNGTAADSASASFKVMIAVKDQHGNENDITPTVLTKAISALPNTPESITSGGPVSTLVSLAGLVLTDSISISITGTESTSVSLSLAAPEPGSMTLVAIGLVPLAIVGLRRWKNRRAV